MQIQELNLYQAGTLSVVNTVIEASLGHCFNDVLKQSCYDTQLQHITEFNRSVLLCCHLIIIFVAIIVIILL